MIHRRCDRMIELLESEVEFLRVENSQLKQALAHTKGVSLPAQEEKQGDVYYMDDARMMELEDNGTSPT